MLNMAKGLLRIEVVGRTRVFGSVAHRHLHWAFDSSPHVGRELPSSQTLTALSPMLRRDNAPLGARAPSLEASNQTQINDLVQRNRALEQTNQKLSDQLKLEQYRAKETVTAIQKQLQREQRESREGCDVIVSCHRLAHLRTIAELETTRTKVLQEEEVSRREKVQRLQRDVGITLFQIREGELEDKIADLEDEKEDLVSRYEEAMNNLRRKLSALIAERKVKAAEISRLENEQEQTQDKLSQLRQEHATLQTSAEAGVIKLERMTLQLEGAQTKSTEFERANDELKRSNADLQRQLEKWQTLETKGNGELETLRKQKIALEVKISNLQDRLDKQSTEKDKELERAAKREEKMKEITKQWQEEAEEQKSQRERADDALDEAHRRIKHLEVELKKALTNVTNGGEKGDEGHMTDYSATGSKSRSINKRSRSPPRSKRGKSTGANDDVDNSESSEVPRKAIRGRPKKKLSPVSEVEEATDTPRERKKPSEVRNDLRKQSKKGKGRAAAAASEDTVIGDDTEQGAVVKPRAVKRRRKASVSDDDIEILGSKPGPAKKDIRQKGQSGKQIKHSKVPNRTNEDEDVSSTEEGDLATEQLPAKKKRKINIFSNPAEPTFTFANNDIDLGLNIPTNLSPVKETTGIPSRSASVMSKIMSKGRLRG